jgi:predicted DNA-binding protein
MTTQMIIRVESSLKSKISQLAKAEGKNLSELVRELLEKYTKERDMSAYIDKLWDRIGHDFAKSNISETDIDEAIKKVRSK